MTENTGQPKYLQVAEALRRAIAAGTYPVGTELPSTAQLTKSFDVSTTVVRAAVRELRNEGLVLGQPGKAVFVRAEPADQPAPVDLAAQIRELSETVHASLQALSDRVAELEKGMASKDQ
jgi:DNA-binding GntR family transcriptional regulator